MLLWRNALLHVAPQLCSRSGTVRIRRLLAISNGRFDTPGRLGRHACSSVGPAWHSAAQRGTGRAGVQGGGAQRGAADVPAGDRGAAAVDGMDGVARARADVAARSAAASQADGRARGADAGARRGRAGDGHEPRRRAHVPRGRVWLPAPGVRFPLMHGVRPP